MLIYNATTKHIYSSANRIILVTAMQDKGWQDGLFAGFHQWKEAGRSVRKGEKGTQVAMFVYKAVTKDGQQEKVKVRKVAYVFNIAQTEPMQPPAFQAATVAVCQEG